jgi:chorismate-pyruvate lyase
MTRTRVTPSLTWRPTELVDRLFVAQDQRPAEVTAVDFGPLPLWLRTLVVTTGTVSSAVEAQLLEPIHVDCLDEQTVVGCFLGARWTRWLEVDGAEPVVSRRVAIRSTRTGRVLVWAESLLAPRRLPAGLADLIAGHGRGIGAALQAAGVETYRDLLWLGWMPGPLWPCGGGEPSGGVGRTYRITVQARPAMLITERFAQRDVP